MFRRLSGTVLISIALLVAGCSHNDQQVATDVQNKINADSSFPDKGLTVTASKGVVTLSGNVSSQTARDAAAKDAAQVDGVKTVVNNLVVAAPSQSAALQPPAIQQPDNTVQPAPAPRAKPSPRVSSSRAGSRGSYSSASRDRDNESDVTVRSARATDPNQSQDANQSNGIADNSTSPVPPPAQVAPPPPQPVTVPSGTQISIRLDSELNSETAQVGDMFRGSISTPIAVGDITVIPIGSLVEGRVIDVKSAGRFAGQSDLVLELTRVVVDGNSYSIATDRWSKAGNARGKSTATKVGGGAAVGAILGGIFGGGKGAAIGAAAGAGAGTGVSAATKGQQIDLKPETLLSFQLQNSIAVVPGAKSRPVISGAPNN
ncbi:MAG TPA: BON domain-containing protein [Candidatus Angelobacter sp.]|nr:BON domain-containing protein [Candidatus Angelobacter sp.]